MMAGLLGVQVVISQVIRTPWREWAFPESVRDPAISPSHLAANRFGDIYAVDRDNNRLVVLPGDGSPPRTAGGWGDQGDRFSSATDIISSPALDVLVCDNATHRILIFDRKLNFVRERNLFNLVPHPIEYPYKIALNDMGEFIVVSSGIWEVNLVSASGRAMVVVGDVTYGHGRLGEVSDLRLGNNGEIGLVDMSSGVLLILTGTGELKRRIPLPRPDVRLVEWWRDRWLVLGPSGHLYELSPSTGGFEPIPAGIREEPVLHPRDFVVSGNTVYVATPGLNRLFTSTLISLER